jgi:hypothetical protein
MSDGKTADEVSVVSDSEVLFMFVTVDGEYPARNIFRRAQIGINYLS